MDGVCNLAMMMGTIAVVGYVTTSTVLTICVKVRKKAVNIDPNRSSIETIDGLRVDARRIEISYAAQYESMNIITYSPTDGILMVSL